MNHPTHEPAQPADLVFKSPYPPVDIPLTSFVDYVLRQNARYRKDLPACIDGLTGSSLSREELAERALALASSLRDAHAAGLLPLSRGSTVMVLSPSSPLYVTLLLALVRVSCWLRGMRPI